MTRTRGFVVAAGLVLAVVLSGGSLGLAAEGAPTPASTSQAQQGSSSGGERLARLDTEIAELQEELAAAQARLSQDLAALQAALGGAAPGGTVAVTPTPSGTPTATESDELRWKDVKDYVKAIKRDLRAIERAASRLSHRVVQRAHLAGLDVEDEDEDDEADKADRRPTATPTTTLSSAAPTATPTSAPRATSTRPASSSSSSVRERDREREDRGKKDEQRTEEPRREASERDRD